MRKKRNIDIESVYLPSNNDRSHRRTSDIEAKYDVHARGIEAGRKNEPRTDETLPDEMERRLLDESNAAIGVLTRMAGAEVSESINEIRRILPSEMNTDLELSTIRREVMEAKDRYRSDLEIVQTDYSRKLRDTRSFEAENRLPPFSALYHDNFAMFYTKLGVLGLSEAALNAGFLQEMQNRGLFGGLLLAFSVGFANILIGLGTGFFGWRLLIHIRIPYRLIGAIITVILMVAALALHLALADLREAITHDVNAKINFLIILQPWSWFHFTSIAPFALFALGIAAFTISALKGRGGISGINSPYWGHDTFDRRFRTAENALLDATDNYKDAVANGYDGERAKLITRHAVDVQHRDEIRRLAAQARGIKQTLGDSIAAEIGRLQIWIEMYRNANRQVRTTPPPAYFETYPSFDEWLAPRLDLNELTELVTEADRIVSANAAKLAALQDRTLKDQMKDIDELSDVFNQSETASKKRMERDDNVAPTPRQKR